MILNLTSKDMKPLPKFRDLPEKYTCTKCKKPLQGPSQTECGHRVCNPCLTELLSGPQPVRCPAGEDGCVDVTESTVSEIIIKILLILM